MFNSPLLDVAIGLVFIFLLYSLLATSVNESIATLFALRARMLKTGIVDSMLSNASNDNRWISFFKGVKEFFLEILKIFVGKREKTEDEKKIGDKFFEHPLIKNYGASRIFPTPSYIPARNFSTVLIDVLKKEFDKRLDDIALYKLSLSSNTSTLLQIKQDLQYNSEVFKIKELLDYYGRTYLNSDTPPPNSVIDKDTWQILQLHLRESLYNIDKFTKNIETWFDDSMNRISGWYKRQTQLILFLLGIVLAIIFNVDTIEISGKLSTDKDARDKLVQMAEQSTDKYKDDPRVRKIATSTGAVLPDTTAGGRAVNDSIFKQYQAKADSIKQFLNNDVKNANDIVALGWGDYGKSKDSAAVMDAYFNNKGLFSSKLPPLKTTPERHRQILDSLYHSHWLRYKVSYVLGQSVRAIKILGFLLTAFAICLGAPFWFDLLNKLVRLRAAGKKEGSNNSNGNGNNSQTSTAQQPVIVNVNTQTGEEAVG